MKEGITVGQLARRGGLSRSALLYYDRLGLLRPSGRSGGNYRLYTSADEERLRQIGLYRNMGIPLKQIGRMLDAGGGAGPTEGILRRRLGELELQIETLQEQQRQIVRLLEQFPAGRSRQKRVQDARLARCQAGKAVPVIQDKEKDVIDKERWVKIMAAAGFDEKSRRNWHRQFERMEPEAHQEFLESLGIGAEEIGRIREWSRGERGHSGQ